MVLAVVLLAGGCTTETKELPQRPPRQIRIINNVEVGDGGRTLTVRYWGTECEQFSDAEIEYGITQVKIAAYAIVIASSLLGAEACWGGALGRDRAATVG